MNCHNILARHNLNASKPPNGCIVHHCNSAFTKSHYDKVLVLLENKEEKRERKKENVDGEVDQSHGKVTLFCLVLVSYLFIFLTHFFPLFLFFMFKY
jgi:hypothetical protein